MCTGEIRKCVLCSRDFCDKHVSTRSSKDLAVCEIDHGTYLKKHRHLPNVYSSLAERRLALGEQDCRDAGEELD